METISGIEALNKMKAMRFDDAKFFVLHHLTYNSTKDATSGLRIVECCRLRKALPKEFSENIDPDMILPYTDLHLSKQGMCYKQLIRFVAFPPEYKLLKVKWYEQNTPIR